MKLLLVLFWVLVVPVWVSAAEIVTIATGSIAGLYYPSGGALCRVYNVVNGQDGGKCVVEATAGSQYNLSAVETGMSAFAFVQADELYDYLQERRKNNQALTVSAVMSLYTEAFVLVVGKNSEIDSYEDLRGKRVNIGVEGSGVRNFTMKVMQVLGLKGTDFKSIFAETQASVEHFVCNDVVDASVVIGGRPSRVVEVMVEKCGARVISMKKPLVDALLKQNPFYVVANVPAGMYVGHNVEIATVGTKAILVASGYATSEQVYSMTSSVIKNFNSFKQYSPVTQGATLNSLNLISQDFPMHSAAKKAFAESGIL